MDLIFLCHPPALGSVSMPRFARMIGEGMRARGHQVTYVTSPSVFGRLPVPSAGLRKWLGYVDQFLIFPLWLRAVRRRKSTLFVVADQALGMWVPALGPAPHVVHCHDFLAQRSALGEFPENPTGWTGRKYQLLIRKGYRRARNFISVSEKTRTDLGRFLDAVPDRNEVVYNPLNYPFIPLEASEVRRRLESRLPLDLDRGWILHVGGNQWYKNRAGVVEIYREYCRREESPIPLLLVGRPADEKLAALVRELPANARVQFASDLADAEVHAAYAGARVLLFPSIEEGFGWPIAEAQASGCPVITTDAAPMREVGADAALYVARRDSSKQWAENSADVLEAALNLTSDERQALIRRGFGNVERFRLESALDQYEKIYREILAGVADR